MSPNRKGIANDNDFCLLRQGIVIRIMIEMGSKIGIQ